MKGLRTIRIVLAIIFFMASVAYLVIGPKAFPAGRMAEHAQIIPSAIAVTMGATLFWILITFLLGRVYCSTVCPVGTFQDILIRLRKKIPGLNRPFRYRHPKRIRYHVLAIYIVCLVVGVSVVPYIIEPWSIMRNICSVANPAVGEPVWLNLGIGVAAGIASGVVSALLIAGAAFLTGRGFCTDVCPIGTALGSCHNYTLFHIEIDPERCVSCMKCEEVCKSQCVKVVGRYVDNSRCVRCFDCLSVCPNDAIRFQINRNRRGTPLIRKVEDSRL